MCGSEVPVSKPCSVMPNSCASLNMDGAHEQPYINREVLSGHAATCQGNGRHRTSWLCPLPTFFPSSAE